MTSSRELVLEKVAVV